MRYRKTIIIFLLNVCMLSSKAQKKADLANIDLLCGCFDVEFKYAETFAPDDEYEYHNRERINWAREIVIPIERGDKKISIQHLLVMDDTIVIKHWREDWVYESPVLLQYNGNYTWNKISLTRNEYKGKWTQTVWEVSDAPRYQGTSEWITTDGKTFWMNTTDAPLPRREYTKRDDYNILKRRNIISVTKEGWIHEQDNQKIIRKTGADRLLAEEKGMNTYKRVDDKKCDAGKQNWEKNKAYWAMVRQAWDKYLAKYSSINVKPQVDGKPLHEYLSELEERFGAKELTPGEANKKIDETLLKFIGESTVQAPH